MDSDRSPAVQYPVVPVILGILSDTHGHADTARAAVELLLARGAEFLIHCGDVGSTAVLDALAGHPAATVWGNTDFDHHRLANYSRHLGIKHDHPALHLELDGQRICVTHGDDLRLVRQLIADRACDYLFVGHTHVASDRTQNGVRVINPGALHRAIPKTVARLDLSTGALQSIIVDT